MIQHVYSSREEEERLQICNRETKCCYSGLMTPTEAIAYWKDPRSLYEAYGDNLGSIFRQAIIRYMMFNRNQSDVERVFSGLQGKATPARPRVQHETVLHEEQLKKFKRQSSMFDFFKELDTEDEDPEIRNELVKKLICKYILNLTQNILK